MESIASSRTLPHALVTRARIVLMAADGMQNLEISKEVGLSRNAVGRWRRRFVEDGIQGLGDELRPGRPRSIGDEDIAQLIAQTLQSNPNNATHWVTRLTIDRTTVGVLPTPEGEISQEQFYGRHTNLSIIKHGV